MSTAGAGEVDRPEAGRYDGAVKDREAARTRRAHCPRCDRPITWHGNPHRPFCSLSCRLIDLGVWLDERYRIPGPELSSESTADEGPPRGGG